MKDCVQFPIVGGAGAVSVFATTNTSRNFYEQLLSLLNHQILFYSVEKYEETARCQRPWQDSFYLGRSTFTYKMGQIKIQV